MDKPTEPHTSNSIAQTVRQWIVDGRHLPGERLPTRAELLERFGVSPVTMQRAFHQLLADGFVETRGKGGTFVAPAPPHLRRYALVLQVSRHASNWYSILANAAEAVSRRDRRVPCYEQVNPDYTRGDYHKLVNDIAKHRVAGLIFGNHPFELDGSALMQELQLPAVALMNGTHAKFPTRYVDTRSFFNRATERLASEGRHRVGVLMYLYMDLPDLWDLQHLRKLGLETEEKYWQITNPRYEASIRRLVYLLLDAPRGTRPDALIVADDNLATTVSQALAHLGVDPADLSVISMCNFPWVPDTTWPLTFLGFDINALMRSCVQSIDDQRDGIPVEPFLRFQASFQDEL